MILFCINYETEAATWKLYLIAENREDATSYVRKISGMDKKFRINSVEQREEIHGLTPSIMDKIAPPVEPEIIIQPQCPWCLSTDFKSHHALKVHIGKNHASVEQKETKKPLTKVTGAKKK